MAELQWFDAWGRANASKCTFCFFIGGRGIGKTYSVLKNHHDDFMENKCGKLVYMRISGAELDAAASEEENPYKRVNYDCGYDVNFFPIKKSYSIADCERDSDGKITGSTVLGTARSLASFHNLRGVDFFDYTEIYLDEFNPVDNVRRTPEIKNAGYLFFNAYETINRNRELLGEPPVRVIFTANAFTMDSSILIAFNLVSVIQHMLRTGQTRYTDKERSIYIELCVADDITSKKRETALYKAAGKGKFAQTALDNQFTDYALSLVNRDVSIKEYYPLIRLHTTTFDITIYKHKSTGIMWAGKRFDTTKLVYTDSTLLKFKRQYKALFKSAVMERTIYFDSADTYYKLMSVIE